QVTATDKSAAALSIAAENALAHGLNNVKFINSDWFSALDNQLFDVIVSNPPYICNNDPHLQQGDVRFEPRSALTAGDDGLEDIRHIIKNSQAHLVHGGILLLEHGYDQATAVCQLLTAAHFEQVNDFSDHNPQPRVAIGHLK
ncbi:MAG: peptide chain release factor N(5)-glutamine methyltransferase, partial [Gammaproteobacteria bacterium]|nr:peptide chain release factor N(5)-glutamine methyltransferase [Gammaproteobacteria bacterium]